MCGYVLSDWGSEGGGGARGLWEGLAGLGASHRHSVCGYVLSDWHCCGVRVHIPADELSLEDTRDPFIRRGSVSSAYDLLPEELGRYVKGCGIWGCGSPKTDVMHDSY